MNIIATGAGLACLGVILGAFGTHGLQGKIGYDLLEIYKTGTYYLMIHALGLILFGLFRPEKTWPAKAFVLGTVIFSGSLYLITFTGIRGFGMITPIGGLFYILGWIGFAVQAKKGAR
jgi:hypothetical protein